MSFRLRGFVWLALIVASPVFGSSDLKIEGSLVTAYRDTIGIYKLLMSPKGKLQIELDPNQIVMVEGIATRTEMAYRTWEASGDEAPSVAKRLQEDLGMTSVKSVYKLDNQHYLVVKSKDAQDEEYALLISVKGHTDLFLPLSPSVQIHP